MHTPEPLITLQARPCELPALEAAVTGYIRLVEATVPPSPERAELIGCLRSFQRRYQPSLRTAQLMQQTSQQPLQTPLLPVPATVCELLAFGSAVIGYIRLLKTTVQPCALRTEVINHLLTFEKRYIDSLPPATYLH